MTPEFQLEPDHTERLKRAMLSLDGLSVGDAFGQCFFGDWRSVEGWLRSRTAPEGPWVITDDSVMAASIVRVLRRFGTVNQEALAHEFAQQYALEPDRGYGGMARVILGAIHKGVSWKAAARQAFDGQGSHGNGGAMRVAPIGAFFADDYDRVVHEAKLSAEITHAHPDGKAGAVAVALAGAWMVREYRRGNPANYDLIHFVLERLPDSLTSKRLKAALEVPFSHPPASAAAILGNGRNVLSSDTVPFCLWCASRHSGHFEDALWATVSGMGDRDTTCAIVGGIVALSAGRESIPAEWLKAREPIQI